MTFSGCDRAALEQGVLTATFLLLATAAWADRLPDAIGRQLPPGYVVLKVAQGRLTGGVRDDYVVALACPGDDPDAPTGGGTARPGRRCCSPRTDGTYALSGRNDDVVLRHDQGGQCDPFDPEQGLVMNGAYVTVQNRCLAAASS